MFSANVCLEISLTLKMALKDTLEKIGHRKMNAWVFTYVTAYKTDMLMRTVYQTYFKDNKCHSSSPLLYQPSFPLVW